MSPRGRPTRTVRPREDLARAVVTVLAQSRLEAGVSRPRLAAMSGVSQHTIAKIEQISVTDPGFTVVATIAAALGLSLDQLLLRARDTLSNVQSVESEVDVTDAQESTT